MYTYIYMYMYISNHIYIYSYILPAPHSTLTHLEHGQTLPPPATLCYAATRPGLLYTWEWMSFGAENYSGWWLIFWSWKLLRFVVEPYTSEKYSSTIGMFNTNNQSYHNMFKMVQTTNQYGSVDKTINHWHRPADINISLGWIWLAFPNGSKPFLLYPHYDGLWRGMMLCQSIRRVFKMETIWWTTYVEVIVNHWLNSGKCFSRVIYPPVNHCDD